ncbi:hypothetical protein PR048_000246 [Dryococelus australis]|uniref:Little elongation complex subunit 2 C-terminal domain-containing protein n=1 Tax=Dryococelus australis TaxID=614101 RepID=A0ABQ9IFA4_9NEOP|nr:hypothetical protein PR048_000246 [Dryococelus australis]
MWVLALEAASRGSTSSGARDAHVMMRKTLLLTSQPLTRYYPKSFAAALQNAGIESQKLCIVPKLEHKLQFGAEKLSTSEMFKSWVTLFFRPGVNLARDIYTSPKGESNPATYYTSVLDRHNPGRDSKHVEDKVVQTNTPHTYTVACAKSLQAVNRLGAKPEHR